MFTFDKDYDNLAQVEPYVAAYETLRHEMNAKGEFHYNDSFKARIPGIEGDCEDTAIYLLQRLHSIREMQTDVNAALAEGFEPVESVDTPVRGSVIRYGWYVGGTGFQRWDNVRLIKSYSGMAVLPARARTNGYLLAGGKVLFK